MTGFAPITSKVDDRGFGESRFGNTINGIVGHIGAGYSVLNYVAGWNSRTNHPTYHIDQNGFVTGLVHPNRRPTTTAHSIDQEAVTVEMDNDTLGPGWTITDKTMASYIELTRWHGSQSPRKGFAKNRPGVGQSEFFIGWHSQYHNVTCPGPYVLKHLDYIVKTAAGGKATKPSKPATASKPKQIPKKNTFVRAPGGERNAPRWPRGPLMLKLQKALHGKGRYNGRIDGIGGELTAKGIQETLNFSQKNGTGRRFVRTPVDGRLGINNAYGVQYYSADFGDYVGPIDGDPLTQSWTNFVLGLERP